MGRAPIPLRRSEIEVVSVHHALNPVTNARIREELTPLLSRTGCVVLDLRNACLDSASLGAVLSIQCRLKYQGRALYVVNPDPAFHHLLEVTGADGALEVFTDVESAMRRAQAS